MMEKQEVRERFSDLEFPDVTLEPVWYGRRGKEQIKGRMAVVGRFGDGSEYSYSIASEQDYKVITHEEVLSSIMDTANRLVEQYGEYHIKPTLLKDGARMSVNLEFPKLEGVPIEVGDLVQVRATAKNSYDMFWRYSLGIGATQLKCTNGAVAFKLMGGMNGKHLQSLDTNTMVQKLNQSFEQFHIQTDEWRRWTEIAIDEEVSKKLWEALPFGEKHREEILALPMPQTQSSVIELMQRKELTAWRMHSAVTQFLSHNVASDMVRIEKTEEIERVFTQFFNYTNYKI